MIKLAGRMADGYLARATESIQSLRALSDGLTRACGSGGRDPSAFGKAAYVLCSVKKKSEEAKHAMRNNPFAIYQFAVMENYVLSQTGFDPEIRKRIAEPYWKGDLPEASKQITDELLDAFTAAGNEDEVVARINDYAQIALPILQPIGVDSEGMRMVGSRPKFPGFVMPELLLCLWSLSRRDHTISWKLQLKYPRIVDSFSVVYLDVIAFLNRFD
jgi:alkanesulfonate monooxygenase SsuD/methylene tetrahydromethanopterin reductase-like flavin-dependent oxidoreductase (luciferase family)